MPANLKAELERRGWRHETPDSFYTVERVWRKNFEWWNAQVVTAADAWRIESRNDS